MPAIGHAGDYESNGVRLTRLTGKQAINCMYVSCQLWLSDYSNYFIQWGCNSSNSSFAESRLMVKERSIRKLYVYHVSFNECKRVSIDGADHAACATGLTLSVLARNLIQSTPKLQYLQLTWTENESMLSVVHILRWYSWESLGTSTCMEYSS